MGRWVPGAGQGLERAKVPQVMHFILTKIFRMGVVEIISINNTGVYYYFKQRPLHPNKILFKAVKTEK